MKTLEQIKAEIAEEVGEPLGFDFLFQTEVEIGDYETARWLYKNLIEKYISQYEAKRTEKTKL